MRFKESHIFHPVVYKNIRTFAIVCAITIKKNVWALGNKQMAAACSGIIVLIWLHHFDT